MPHASGLRFSTAAGLAVLIFVFLAACDERSSSTGPTTGHAAIAFENVTATATKPGAIDGPFTYRVSMTVRENGGAGATVSQVTTTLSETSGARTETQVSAVEAFGTTHIPAHGTLTSSGITVTGPLATATDITVRVAFVDDRGNTGSAQTTAGVKAEFTGEWSGSTTITQPPGDWSRIRMLLVQSGDALTGELITRDGRRFPLSGCVSCEWAPVLSIGGLPKDSSGCAIFMIFPDFGFSSGQMRRLVGQLIGRCPSTASGTAELERM
jgi:hypothetical protein